MDTFLAGFLAAVFSAIGLLIYGKKKNADIKESLKNSDNNNASLDLTELVRRSNEAKRQDFDPKG